MNTSGAYRGYSWIQAPYGEPLFYISKDGFHIGTARSLTELRAIIDEIA